MGYMLDKLGEAELLIQYAEELAEEAKAALKLARVLRGINPTPVTEMEARKDLVEEYNDIINCARDLGLKESEELIRLKQERFAMRWRVKERTRQQATNAAPAVIRMAEEINQAMAGKIFHVSGPGAEKSEGDVLQQIAEITRRYEDEYYG